MKIRLPIILFLFLMSCAPKDRMPFRWEPLLPEADTLCMRIDRGLVEMDSGGELLPLVVRLESIAARNPGNRQLKCRSLYFKGRVKSRIGKINPTEYFRKALRMCDSAKFPYDWHRIACVADGMYTDAFVRLHSNVLNAIEYSRRTEDPFLEAEALTELNMLKSLIQDTVGNIRNMARVVSLYKQLGFADYELRSRMNLAMCYFAQGDKASASRILETLSKDRRVKSDPLFEARVLLNRGYVSRDPVFPRKVLELARKYPDLIRPHFILATSVPLTDFLYERGHKEEAFAIARRYQHYAYTEQDIDEEIWMSWLNSVRLESEGDAAGALRMLRRSDSLRLRFNENLDRDKAMQLEARYKIESMQERNRRDKNDERLHWLLGLAVTVIAAMAIFMAVSRRLHRERLRKQEALMDRERYLFELERERRELTSSSLVMMEKDNLLQSILDDIGRMRGDDSITSGNASKLEASIRTHLGGRQEWEQFRVMFDKVHPSFANILRTRYPALTEGDIKMAIYIKMGLSTKQISRMLMLQPGSVKKNRHRLRERMGLAPDVSLEDTLRSLV